MRGLNRLTSDASGLPPEPEPRPRNAWAVPGMLDTFFIGPVVSSVLLTFTNGV